eukprot:Ihof_evm5s158 gene=Ihof_evmTU5s158
MVEHKKWRKGQSGASNPESRRFRDAAKKVAGIQEEGAKPKRRIAKAKRAPQLTVAALALHNKVMSANDHEGSDEEEELTLEQVFAKVHRHMNSPMEAHKEACAVLECVKEVIVAEGGVESETAYFATLMTLLEKHKDDSDALAAVTAVAYLLSLIFPRVPSTVLRSRFSDAATVIMQTLSSHSDESTSMTKGLLECLGHLLVVQEAAVWNHPITLQALHTLFHFTQDSRPKIRHRSHDLITKMLRKPPPPMSTHPAAGVLTNLLKTRMESASKTDFSPTLHDLAFLTKAIVYLPVAGIQTMCEQLLRLLTLGHPVVIQLSMQTLEALMSAGTETTLTAELAARLLNALFDYQPHMSDAETYNLWMSVVSKGTALLSSLDYSLGYSHLPRVSNALIAPLKADTTKSWESAAKGLITLVEGCLAPYPRLAQEALDQKESSLHTFIVQLEGCLGYQCSATWGHVVGVLSALFKALGRASYPLLNKALLSAANLNTVHGFTFKNELRDMIGSAVLSMGARNFFTVHPLELENENVQTNFPRAWVLPIAKDYLKHTELVYFADEILPLAVRLENKSRILPGQNQAMAAKMYHQLYIQLWDLLPGFCTLPTDGPEGMKKIAKTIGGTMEKDNLLAPTIALALQTFISGHRSYTESETAPTDGPAHMTRELAQAAIAMIGGFSKNFLPILFNSYQAAKIEQRAHLMACIVELLAIAPPQVITFFFEGIIKKLLEASTVERTPSTLLDMHVFMDLLWAMLPRLEGESLDKYFKVIKPYMVDEDGILQKQTYKALALLWSSDVVAHTQFAVTHFDALRAAVTDTLLASSGAAKKNRLRLLVCLVQWAQGENLQLIPGVIAEAILATKEVNEKTRNLAYKVLVEMGNTLKRAGEQQDGWTVDGQKVQANIQELFTMVMAGLGGQSPHMISASVNALGRLTYEFSADMTTAMMDDLMETCLLLMKSKSREILKAVLGFAKVVLVVIKPADLQRYLNGLIEATLSIPEEERAHFKMKVRVIFERLIRKFGVDTINNMVPEEHRKLITNIRKRKERATRQKNELKEKSLAEQEATDSKKKKPVSKPDTFEEALYGSESEGSDDEYEKKTGGAWLQDDADDQEMLDFLDPSVVKRVVASKPAQHKRETWDKYKGGKMVIDEEESEEEMPKIKGKKIEEDWEDASDEEMDLDEEASKKKQRKNEKRRAIQGHWGDDAMDLDRPAKKKRTEDGPVSAGVEYKAKKAKGDVKKSGKHDPFAYVPLQKKFMNK